MTDQQKWRTCAVCGTPTEAAVYASETGISVTSLCAIVHLDTKVFFCNACGHLQTPQLTNVNEYYDSEYKILIDSEDEDQLYRLTDGRQVFRSEHQAETLLDQVSLPEGARVLDYGCAKAATMKRIQAGRPDLSVHLFDVSDMYLNFWERLTTSDKWATYTPREEWQGGYFDLITSFYSLEHMPEPRSSVRSIARMLRAGGIFYAIVPNWQANSADFVVVDHVNHFTKQSLARLVVDVGLEPLVLSDALHDSALVVVARKPPVGAESPHWELGDLPALQREVRKHADYWGEFQARVQAFEAEQQAAGARSAIYGSGFYGSYIASCLKDPSVVECFLDQNPYRQGKTLLGKPVIAPEALPVGVQALYVGLNPAKARLEMTKAPALAARKLRYFFP